MSQPADDGVWFGASYFFSSTVLHMYTLPATLIALGGRVVLSVYINLYALFLKRDGQQGSKDAVPSCRGRRGSRGGGAGLQGEGVQGLKGEGVDFL
jgi:hypothetical protein